MRRHHLGGARTRPVCPDLARMRILDLEDVEAPVEDVEEDKGDWEDDPGVLVDHVHVLHRHKRRQGSDFPSQWT